ncbi:MAG: hypothetical protein R3F62_06560 [Planctomycetota bacterium]
MADAQRRSLERAVLAGEQAEALLRARVRSGELSELALRFAAYLGREDAARVVGASVPELLPARRLRRVLRAGIPSGAPGETERLEDRPTLLAWGLDCAARIQELARPWEPEVESALASLRTADPTSRRPPPWAYGSLNQAAYADRAGSEELRLLLASLLSACWESSAHLRAKAAEEVVSRFLHAIERKAPAAVGLREAGWCAARLAGHLLGDRLSPVVPLDPAGLEPEVPRSRAWIPLERGARWRCTPIVAAQVAVQDDDLRRGLRAGLEALSGEAPDVTPVPSTGGGAWFSLPLDSRTSWRRRARAHLLVRQIDARQVELMPLHTAAAVRVDEETNLFTGEVTRTWINRGNCRLVEPAGDAAWILHRLGWADFGEPLFAAELGEVIERFAALLRDAARLSGEARTALFDRAARPHVSRREAERAARAEEVLAGSREVTGDLEVRDGDVLQGACPRCGASGELRVCHEGRVVLCYPCYFAWW